MTKSAANPRALRLGTRGSKLARWQAEWVANELRRLGSDVELIEIATRGDTQRAASIEEIGTRGVFTKEIQRALLAGDVDLAVHSLKDLPTEPVEGLVLAAVPARESSADVLVVGRGQGTGDRGQTPKNQGLNKEGWGGGTASRGLGYEAEHSVLSTEYGVLPVRARVGTGSLRRQAQLLHARSDLRVEDVRGNVDTRLRKLDEGLFDAIVLAEAGLRRLGLADRVTQVLPVEIMLPAVGQGALAIECRADDAKTRATLAPLEDPATRAAVTAERSLLAQLRGGCMAPIGALGRLEAGALHLSAVVLSANGSQRLAASDSATPSDAEELGRRLAAKLVALGAAELIASARQSY